MRILPLDEFFNVVVKSFQILQNQYKFSVILFWIMENWRFDIIFLCLKWFCFIEKLIEWQNSQKAYKKQTLIPRNVLFADLTFNSSTPETKATLFGPSHKFTTGPYFCENLWNDLNIIGSSLTIWCKLPTKGKGSGPKLS